MSLNHAANIAVLEKVGESKFGGINTLTKVCPIFKKNLKTVYLTEIKTL